ncbi:hypothetical protein DPMN_168667 [Dreissena polymorpha]|uniref:Uncharacterized protein n=1 Tax=Dreissena polymorpha TaxID=45954 RepID=A0A9D4F139_DREPO|nr:hypothetical protein DPMN_168667 [Dreissena polymorpha]
MMYRIINNLVDSNARSVLIPAGVHTRGNANCYIVPLTTVQRLPVYLLTQLEYASGMLSQNRWTLSRP